MFDEVIAPLFTSEWGKRSSFGAAILLSLLIAYLLISSLFTWYHDFIIVLGKNKQTVTATPSDENSKIIARLPEQHLFGKSGVIAATTTLPITSLNLRLMGVIKSEPDKLSRVIISEKGQPGKIYQVGDTLPSGVRVYSITDKGVILENGGRLESLPLQRPSLNFQGTPKSLFSHDAKEE